ncbi:hypothetical protein M2307_007298, partial [Bradyrhizobium japonicum]|nr:hypothetical protein [Bradyrhizobium japonicum]
QIKGASASSIMPPHIISESGRLEPIRNVRFRPNARFAPPPREVAL